MKDDPDLLAAIQHGVDAGGCSIAMRSDPGCAAMWRALAEDQDRLAAQRLDKVVRRSRRHRERE